MANKRQKHPALLQGHRPRPQLVTIPRDAVPSAPPPPPPPGLLAVTRRRWERFWRSPVAALVDRNADMVRLERWAYYLDEWERCRRASRRQLIVAGSQGQPVVNPLAAHMLHIERELRAIEERFGLTPLDRMRLGVQLGEAHRSLADLRAMPEDDKGDTIDFEVPEGYRVIK